MNGFPWLTVAGASRWYALADSSRACHPLLGAISAPGDVDARSRLAKVLALAVHADRRWSG